MATPSELEPGASGAEQTRRQVEAWVRQAQAGDRGAFERLHHQLAGRIQRHLRVLLGPTGDVDDALQNVFLEAYRNLHKFDGSSQFSTWLHGIAVRVALNLSRARRRRGRAMSNLAQEAGGGTKANAPSPESATHAQRELARLHRLLEDVDDGRRVPFLLYYVEQVELGELARQLRLTPGATWARIKRARAEVLQAMAREERVRARAARSTP